MSSKKVIRGAAGFACVALVLVFAQEAPPAAGGSAPGASGDTSSPREPNLYHVGAGVTQPVPLYRPDPEYSEEARKAKYQGTVILAIVVDENGIPRNVRVVKPLGMGLDREGHRSRAAMAFPSGYKGPPSGKGNG